MTSASTSPTSDSKHHSDTNSVNTMTTAVPQLLSTPGTHTSQNEPKEYMKLTPVHLQCLTSPLRQGGIAQGNTDGTNCLSNQEFRIDDTYKENFNLISRQLEKLLEGLNVIYRKIGYSNAEIVGKEKLIFNTLSGSITSFFDHAENDMKNLTEENETAQEILNRMLEIMRDSSGIDTIPDIYVRNAILIPSCKTVFQSPKKPLSILSKRKLLRTARGFVFKSYLPAFIRYMEVSIRLQALVEVVGEKLGDLPNGGEMVNDLPSLESLKHYREDLKSHQTNLDFISNYFVDHKGELLYNDHFNDISEDKIQILGQTIQIYQEEYDFRISHLKSVPNNISQLVSELKTDLDPQVQRILSLYLQLDSNVMPKMYTSVHKSTIESLEKVLREQQTIYEKRKEIKEALLTKCESLWNRLKIPQAYIDNFLKHCEGHSTAVTRKIVRELEKLEEMKKKLIKTLIEESSQRIEELWSFLQYEDEEKSQFLYIFESLRESSTTLEDDERLLEACENEIKSLEEKLSVYKPTLQLVQEFESLRADKLSLETSSKDSSRLLARNSHKILLQEEKTRKRVTRHFPRVIKDLKNGLEDIQTTFGKPLVVNGQDMMEIVTQVEEELISKYPKSRLNLGGTNSKMGNSSTRSSSNNEGRVTKKSIPEKGRRSTIPARAIGAKTTRAPTQIPAAAPVPTPVTNHRASSFMNQTPVTKIIGGFPTVNDSTTTKLDSSQNKKYMRGFKAASPTVQANSLLPPKLVTRLPNTRIPEPSRIARKHSGNLSSSPVFQPRPVANLVRPATLFQVSPNKINQQRSQIPTLSKSSSILTQEFMNSVDKENLVDSTPRLQQKGEFLNFSSPYREPDNSVYKISKSPDGKCTLKVREDSHLESGFDDTSILDEDNEKDFNTWKNEQLAKVRTIRPSRQQAP
ncbi:hypothetical protein ZYGR_0H05170 [Zygosaccharomyces rouxii]|uniref:Plant heme peroxidase family profile domain-containing protein n=1 Tax=Zygosaccharomyces rouxii TaxID=4956 RepID=A0A1Q2ZW34_ZYGRO|nr:hypothetical protein ZYGR_0H05170 [Zygosaccharomyces rouxii]